MATSSGVSVLGNEIARPGFSGVTMSQVTGAVVAGNYIHDTGYWSKDAGAVVISNQSAHNAISHNLLSHGSKFGVFVNAMDSATVDNNVEYNHIYHMNREQSDGGSIDTIQRGNTHDQASRWRFNNVVDPGGFGDSADGTPMLDAVAYGLYLDEAATGITVFGNTVDQNGTSHALQCHGVRQHDGAKQRVRSPELLAHAARSLVG